MAAMRIAVLSDVHSNIEALDAVLEDAGAEGVVVLGDIVGYNADPVAVLKRLHDVDALLIAGNHDLAAVNRFDVRWFNPVAAQAVRWTATQLDPAAFEGLAHLEPSAWWNGRLLVHGSVREPAVEYVRDELAAAASFAAADFDVGFHGHTHVPAAFMAGPAGVVEAPVGDGTRIEFEKGLRYFLNPGSVGQPRDGDPRAAYVILEESAAEWRRVEYDVTSAMRKIRESGLPDVLADRLEVGR